MRFSIGNHTKRFPIPYSNFFFTHNIVVNESEGLIGSPKASVSLRVITIEMNDRLDTRIDKEVSVLFILLCAYAALLS